jgi:3-isopropylmalate/(R)-2-methylmalate dehydratase small subunit
MGQVVIKLGKDISTDDIYPGRFMATVLPTETPQYCFNDRAEFNARLKARTIAPGSVVVAEENFGCGSSREQAASALKGYELVVVAKGIARIFLQNAINVGLRLVLCPGIEAGEGDELELTASEVLNKTTGKAFAIVPWPPARQAIIDAGGLIPYTRKKLMEA